MLSQIIGGAVGISVGGVLALVGSYYMEKRRAGRRRSEGE